MARLLVASAQPSVQLALRHILERRGDSFELASSAAELRKSVELEGWDGLVADPSLLEGLEPSLPVILLAPGGSLDGLAGFLDGLPARPERKVQIQPAGAPPDSTRVYRSEAWAQVERAILRYAAHDLSVLVLGESGTGKELVARALHEAGPRNSEPFVAIHCGALPAELLESELFGHERGAFTDAHQRKLGRFEEAGGGTIFLDEIGEMSNALQAKLLRALQERSFTRVGGNGEITLHARVVAATHRDLPAMVADGSFREDLLHRLRVGVLQLPPLRERPEDLEPLCREFLRRCREAYAPQLSGLDDEAWGLLQSHDWPGNVRQLENVLRRAAITMEGTVIGQSELGSLDTPSAGEGSNWSRAIAVELRKRMDSGQSIDEALSQMQSEIQDYPRKSPEGVAKGKKK